MGVSSELNNELLLKYHSCLLLSFYGIQRAYIRTILNVKHGGDYSYDCKLPTPNFN
jgi:hypothetical protein